MHRVSLTKDILPGTWRYLGQRCPHIYPSSVPIAGREPAAIARALDGELYQIGRYEVRNAFLVVKNNARFLYVRPGYSGYRRVTRKVFSKVPWNVDYDHALSRRIANAAKPAYKYVLLLRVPPSVNRQHGHSEKKDNLGSDIPSICFADDRIFDKWLGRSPLARGRSPAVLSGYSTNNVVLHGLTLKQKGHWAYAIGMGDNDLAMDYLKKSSK